MKTEQEIQRTRNHLIRNHIDEIHRLVHQLDTFFGDPDDGVQSSEQKEAEK